jgi:hypothetical protein
MYPQTKMAIFTTWIIFNDLMNASELFCMILRTVKVWASKVSIFFQVWICLNI